MRRPLLIKRKREIIVEVSPVPFKKVKVNENHKKEITSIILMSKRIDEYENEGKTIQIDGRNLDDEKSQSNGSGKSTLLESFCYGWFGELCRKNRYKDE